MKREAAKKGRKLFFKSGQTKIKSEVLAR